MSYQRPHDPYMHSNASQYDNQYSGHYDSPGQQYGSQQSGYHYGSQTPQSDHYYKDGSYGGAPGSGNNPAQATAAKYSYAPAKKGKSKWVKWGIPLGILAILIIAGAVLGGIFGSRAASNNGGQKTGASTFSGQEGSKKPSNIDSSVASAASSAAAAGGGDQLTYQGTDLYGNPAFLSTATTASPTGNGQEVATCTDNSPPSGSLTSGALRDHPRLMAAQYEWDCLPQKIAKDAYLTVWNASIFENATNWANQPPTAYDVDGGFDGSGILDPARDVQQRIKAWAYAYRISKNTKWVDRAWTELQAAAGNSSTDVWKPSAVQAGLADDQVWNPAHFLDTAELTAAFGIAYDWLYDVWTPDQRQKIMWSIITNGLNQGMTQYSTSAGWWKNTNGNWNCVCNSGLLLGALAIWTEDPTGTAAKIVQNAVPNMQSNCMQGAYEDGTWSETANYWYFGTDAQARAMSSLLTSTGNDQGLLSANQGWGQTGLFHMYVTGQAGLFAYGDNGPNKYSTTANGMFLWAKQYKMPIYGLFQRDRADAADPLSMFWYDTSSKGAFWNGLALDKFFDNELGSWASMRSSWTDTSGTYIGVKSSNATGHQTHGDLDAGDFVFDALGTRWAGEYGSANYLSTDYFKSEADNAVRWQYYRKGTQGQNTLVINNENQAASCHPINKMETTGVKQTGAIDFVPGKSDVAYFTTDMSSCYNQASSGSVQRGIRFLNGRRQMLVQDEIKSSSSITSVEWRMQTNATVTLSDDKRTATLKISKVENPNAYGGADEPFVQSLPKTETVILTLQQPSGATFSTQGPPAEREYGSDPNTAANEEGDQLNKGVTVLSIKAPSPSGTIAVWFQPQWDNLNDADKTAPPSVALSDWSLTSHN
ncbi:hypothetical protein BDZ90DRAFT_232623 [Jaminaea rosea]|uniref:Heparinase II/III-like C-terminal domain-containing protein n=1 Tax=Jaminaea rosea TaxID=1569628 RepID=A0A316URW3_9BASI|nr:hypothetical protein BDZ90DRAFT_232623 [Jaminaea rosea]PWN27061.1 hypothetical protein BDZ90DRAFT_232623 [Jaminaea rosea]